MPNPVRYHVHTRDGGETTVEITARTFQERFLLRPCAQVNGIVAGVLARAKERYGVEVHSVVAMSNHLHLIISVRSVRQQARFMQYVKSNVARKVGRLYGWRGRLWHRRYRAIEISPDEASLVDRFDYLLRHGTKEGLVSCPTEWPGLHVAWALVKGAGRMAGFWDDLTKAFLLRSAGRRCRTRDIRSREILELDPLPCWRHWEFREIRRWVLDRLEQIRDDHADQKFLGVRAVLDLDVEDRPRESRHSPAPDFHSRDPEARKLMREAYRTFVRAYREAAIRLEDFFQGEADPYYFPSGCHPPPPPVVPETA